MENLAEYIKKELEAQGADLVGIGSLDELPSSVRCGLPFGISIAVKYPKEVIEGISELPTKEYYDCYNQINEKLDMLAECGAKALKKRGFNSVPQTRAYVNKFENDYGTLLPHKTVATHAGLGWIGKCALLITEKYGSMIRITSILTDAPLDVNEPINKSKCGECKACVEACPAGAVTGESWSAGVSRDELFNAVLCRKTARERAKKGFGIEATQCGKCIEVCPYTKRYIRGN